MKIELSSYLPTRPTTQEVKALRYEWECSIQQARTIAMAEYRTAMKVALHAAIEDHARDPRMYTDWFKDDILIVMVNML
jgi:hypothetical protein